LSPLESLKILKKVDESEFERIGFKHLGLYEENCKYVELHVDSEIRNAQLQNL